MTSLAPEYFEKQRKYEEDILNKGFVLFWEIIRHVVIDGGHVWEGDYVSAGLLDETVLSGMPPRPTHELLELGVIIGDFDVHYLNPSDENNLVDYIANHAKLISVVRARKIRQRKQDQKDAREAERQAIIDNQKAKRENDIEAQRQRANAEKEKIRSEAKERERLKAEKDERTVRRSGVFWMSLIGIMMIFGLIERLGYRF